MKKMLRNSVLSLATLLALVSCGAPAVTEEVAKKRAQEITTKREETDFSLPTKLTVSQKVSTTVTIKVGDEKESEKTTVSSKLVMDLDAGYFYSGNTVNDEKQEIWGYLEGTKIILAQASGTEKVYTEIPEANLETFTTTLSNMIQSAYSIVLGADYLDLENVADTSLDNIGIGEGLTLDAKASFTSTGEGNLGLTVSGKASGRTVMEGVNVDVSITLKESVVFDQYLLEKDNMSFTVNASSADIFTMTMKGSSALNVSYGTASISKPDLSSFTKQ